MKLKYLCSILSLISIFVFGFAVQAEVLNWNRPARVGDGLYTTQAAIINLSYWLKNKTSLQNCSIKNVKLERFFKDGKSRTIKPGYGYTDLIYQVTFDVYTSNTDHKTIIINNNGFKAAASETLFESFFPYLSFISNDNYYWSKYRTTQNEKIIFHTSKKSNLINYIEADSFICQ